MEPGYRYIHRGPYYDGERAHCEGKKQDQNPFDVCTQAQEYLEWEDGWKESAFYSGWENYTLFNIELEPGTYWDNPWGPN